MFNPAPYITPLYVVQGGIPEPGGTGIWLQVGPEKFLVTAAHVIDEGFVWFPREQGFKRISSRGGISNSPTVSRRDDRVDFAVFHLNEEDLSSKHPYHQFVQISNVEVDLNYRTGDPYQFTGFPYRKEKLKLHSKETVPQLVSISSVTASEAVYAKLGVSTATHVVIEFDRKRMLKDGKQTTAPLPDGMSGGAVWRHCSDFTKPKLAAVVIEHRQGHLVGTAIFGVLEYIRGVFPALRGHIPKPRNVAVVVSKSGEPIAFGTSFDHFGRCQSSE